MCFLRASRQILRFRGMDPKIKQNKTKTNKKKTAVVKDAARHDEINIKMTTGRFPVKQKQISIN